LLTALSEILDEFLAGGEAGFFEADDVDVIFVVLAQFQLVALVQQIKQLSTVNFVKGQLRFQVSELRLHIFPFTLAKYSKMSLAPKV
jgi:hypothetical protein